MFTKRESGDDRHLELIKAKDEQRIKLASKPFFWQLHMKYEVRLLASENRLAARMAGVALEATDGEYRGVAV